MKTLLFRTGVVRVARPGNFAQKTNIWTVTTTATGTLAGLPSTGDMFSKTAIQMAFSVSEDEAVLGVIEEGCV